MKITKYIAVLLAGIGIAFGSSAFAAQISVPSASAVAQMLVSLANGTYQASSSPTLAGRLTASSFTATSTTVNNVLPLLSVTRSTTTNATSTSLGITGILSSLLKTTSTGGVVAAVLGTDYINLSSLSASSPISYNNGTGAFSWTGLATTSQPSSSNLLISNGGAGVYGVATTSATCSGNTTCTSFTVIGSSPITISSTGGGTGLSTTSPVSNSNVLVYSSVGAGSAYGVATTSLSVTGPITFSGTLGAQIGGAAGSFGCATCATFTYPFPSSATTSALSLANITFSLATGTAATTTNFFSSSIFGLSGTFGTLTATGTSFATQSNIPWLSITNSTTTRATTTSFFATLASTSQLFLATGACSGSNALNTNAAGLVVCGAVSGSGSASSTLLSDNNTFSGNNFFSSATNTIRNLTMLNATATYATVTKRLVPQDISGWKFASAYSGADIGARANAAYADCPTSGCSIFLDGYGTSSFTTKMNFQTQNKPVTLMCPSSLVLDWTGSGTSTVINTGVVAGGDYSASYGIYNCRFNGPDAIAGTETGIEIGGTGNGAQGINLQGVTVVGFRKGIVLGNNTWNFTITNSWMGYNGRNFVSECTSNCAEAVTIYGTKFTDSPEAFYGTSGNNCIDLGAGGIAQASFTNNTYDDCGFYVGDGVIRLDISGGQFENPGWGAVDWNKYAYIRTATSSNTIISLRGVTIMNDADVTATPAAPIINAARLDASDVTLRNESAAAWSYFVYNNTTGTGGTVSMRNICLSSNGATSPISSITNNATGITTPAIGSCINEFDQVNNAGPVFKNITSLGLAITGTTTYTNRVGIASTTPGTDLGIGNTSTSYINLSTTSTSTFSRGVAASVLNITSSTATSTFANGIQLSAGCFRDSSGSCITSSVGSGASSTLLGDNNTFTGSNIFNAITRSTTTQATTTNAFASSLFSLNGTFTTINATGTSFATQSSIPFLTITRSTTTYATTTYLNVSGGATTTFGNGISLSGGCFFVNGACITPGAGSSAVGGTGAIQYANGTSFAGDNTKFTWDSTNYRLAVGTGTPWASLSVQAKYAANTNLIDLATSTNSSGSATTSLFFIRRDGSIYFNQTDDSANNIGMQFLASTTNYVTEFTNRAGDSQLHVSCLTSYCASTIVLDSTAAEYSNIKSYVGGSLKWQIGRAGDSDGVSIYTVDGLTKVAQFTDTQATNLYGVLTVGTTTGASSPTLGGTLVNIVGPNGGPARVQIDTFNSNSTFGSQIQGRRSRGTGATPSALALDDTILSLSGAGYGASQYSASSIGNLALRANDTYTDTSNPSRWEIYSTKIGSVVSTLNAMISTDSYWVNKFSRFAVGTTTASSTAGAIQQFYVNGNISSSRRYIECSMWTAMNNLTADGTRLCSAIWDFDEDTAGATDNAVANTNFGMNSVRIWAGATAALTAASLTGEGAAITPTGGTAVYGWASASSTPDFETAVSQMTNTASTSLVQAGLMAASTGSDWGTPYTANGCWFVASTTRANWAAAMADQGQAAVFVDTGVASTTYNTFSTATSTWNKLNIHVEVDSSLKTKCFFYVDNVLKAVITQASVGSGNKSMLNPIVSLGTTRSGSGHWLRIGYIRTWADFMPAIMER